MIRIAILAAAVLFASALGAVGENARTALAVDPMFGDGSDGAITFSSNAQFNPPVDAVVDLGSSAGSTLTVSSLSGVFLPGHKILIHQTRGSGAGAWELNSVQSYALGNLATSAPLANTYASSPGADRAQVLVVPQYSNVTVDLGVTVTAKPWDGTVGGILAVLANGTVTVSGTIDVSGASVATNGIGGVGRGFRGGNAIHDQHPAYQGEGTGGAGGGGVGDPQPGANGNGGGGADAATAQGSSGGGGGGNGAVGGVGIGSGSPGLGGNTAGNPVLTVMAFGGGGGGASRDESPLTAGGGGAGGGIALVVAANLVATGSFNGNGGNASGNSGGGAGGSILMRVDAATLGTALVLT